MIRTPLLVSGLVTLVMLAAGVARLEAQTFLFDFGGFNTTEHGPAPDDPVNYWNNVTETIGASPTGQLLDVVTTLGASTDIDLRMVSRFNAVNENGAQNSSVFPRDATRDSLYGNTAVFNGLGNVFPSFKLTGLDVQAVY